nr:FAD-dependent oxidoreductase [Cryptosporangium phraense]
MGDRRAHKAWQDASHTPFWLDNPDRPAPRAALAGADTADLAVVGAGFAGLWTALLAKERDPARDVVVLEGARVGWAASGRNGGFCSASLTHGRENGLRHFPDEIDELTAMGLENLDEIEAAIARYGIDCGWERNGTLSVATEPWQLGPHSGDGVLLDRDGVRAEIDSPRYVGGVWEKHGSATLDPAALAWGLARACEAAGVRIYERSPVTGLHRLADGVRLTTARGVVRAGQVALATNAFPALLRRVRLYTVPVYDYVLVTEPLSDGQLAAIGWANRQGLSERANQFHYSRLTRDNRILWGGYDAIYHYGRALRRSYDTRPETFDRLAEQFFDTFPQLDGLRFTHAWGGAIDTCTRFFALYGTAWDRRVTYALGFTGLGVAATRFAGNVMLDLLDDADTERTRLGLVRHKPIPFPPEPLAYAGIQATRASLIRADETAGRRNLWLRSLDRLGLGFDS